MVNLTEPAVPELPNWLGRQLRRLFGDWYDDKDAIFIFGKM